MAAKCDQMAWFFQYLAIYNIKILSNNTRNLPKLVQKFAEY